MNRRPGWVGLLLRLFVFLSPLLIATVAIETGLWRSGEAIPLQVVAETQPPDALVGRTFFAQQFNLYKTGRLKVVHPRILALGSSRVMQLRGQVFGDRAQDFYNGGGLVRNVADLETIPSLLERVGGQAPEGIVVFVDPWWLRNSERDQTSWLDRTRFEDEALRPRAHVRVIRQIARSPSLAGRLLRRAGSPSPGEGLPGYGTAPLAYGSGFRSDGSYQYRVDVFREYNENPGYVDREDPPILQRALEGTAQFDWNGGLDSVMVRRLERALVTLLDLDSDVQVVLPPFAAPVAEVLATSDRHRLWWEPYWGELPERLRALGLEVWGVATPQDLGLGDEYMFDGFHPSEVLLAELFRQEIVDRPWNSVLTADDERRLARLVEEADMPLAFSDPKR